MNKEESPSSWATTIQSVRTPIAFFSLTILALGGAIAIVATSVQEPAKIWVIAGLIMLIALLIAIVAILAVRRPEALHGRRPKVAAASEETKASQSESAQNVAKESGTRPELVDPALVEFIPPLSAGRFKTLELPRHDPTRYYQSPYAPTGRIMIYEIPFSLLPVSDAAGNPIGHLAVDLKPAPDNAAASDVISVGESNIRAVHFLLAAGHGWRQRDGVILLHRCIGYIRLGFPDGTGQTAKLVLGKNIREWAFGNNPNLVTEIDTSQTRPAWVSHDNRRRIDLFSVQIEQGPRAVSTIEIVAKFEEDYPNREITFPAILVSAVTLERQA